MSRIGWISAVLFIVQAAYFTISISDFMRFSRSAVLMARDDCEQLRNDRIRYLDCNAATSQAGAPWEHRAYIYGAGLLFASGLTMLGMYSGVRGRRSAGVSTV
ncbi:MAG: hypothetical protein ACK4MF_06095 [Hyphomicrobiaceae bacterium]